MILRFQAVDGGAMKVYRGRRGANGTVVTVNDQPLAPRTDLGSFSETGFEWGYNGGGPNQLALAILSDYFGDGAKALNLYKGFCQSVISMIKGDEWTLSDTQIDNSLENITVVPMTLQELLDKVRGRG